LSKNEPPRELIRIFSCGLGLDQLAALDQLQGDRRVELGSALKHSIASSSRLSTMRARPRRKWLFAKSALSEMALSLAVRA